MRPVGAEFGGMPRVCLDISLLATLRMHDYLGMCLWQMLGFVHVNCFQSWYKLINLLISNISFLSHLVHMKVVFLSSAFAIGLF